MGKTGRITLVAALAVLAFGVGPFIYFRSVYSPGKRLREVTPGRVYRSGQLTAEGFEETIARFGIRTVINVQDDFPDPKLSKSFWNTGEVQESTLCRRLGVRFVQLSPDLVSRKAAPEKHPLVLDQFLELMDDPALYPVLIHCKAGLHRTGILTAVYRMEYEGWSPGAAYREMKDMGFGPWVCTAANDYVFQYVLSYRPRAAGKANGLTSRIHGRKD